MCVCYETAHKNCTQCSYHCEVQSGNSSSSIKVWYILLICVSQWQMQCVQFLCAFFVCCFITQTTWLNGVILNIQIMCKWVKELAMLFLLCCCNFAKDPLNKKGMTLYEIKNEKKFHFYLLFSQTSFLYLFLMFIHITFLPREKERHLTSLNFIDDDNDFSILLKRIHLNHFIRDIHTHYTYIYIFIFRAHIWMGYLIFKNFRLGYL